MATSTEGSSKAGTTSISNNELKKKANKKWQIILASSIAGVAVLILSAWIINNSISAKAANAAGLDITPSQDSTVVTRKNTASPTAVATESPKPISLIETEGYGNNPDNLSTAFLGGFAVAWNERIYFSSCGQIGIFSMNTDGSDIRNFREGNYFGLNAIDDSLFFSNGNTIYRIDADGSEYSYLLDEFALMYLCYYNGYLYYCGQNTSGVPTYQMRRISSDFNSNKTLFEFSVKPESIIVSNNSVYYKGTFSENTEMFETNWVTSETRIVTTTVYNTINVKDDQLYACSSGDSIIMTSLNTGEEVTLANSSGMGHNRVIEKGSIYYSLDAASKSGIWVYNIDNGTKEQIWEYKNNSFSFNIAGGWIFARSSIGEVYAIRLPSGNAQLLVDENKTLTTTNADDWKNTIIKWKDKSVEFCIRIALDKPEGDITFGDADEVEELYFFYAVAYTSEDRGKGLEGHYTGERTGYVDYNGIKYPFRTIGNLSDLSWFTSLEKLVLNGIILNCSLTPLADLSRLTYIFLNSSGSFKYTKGSFGLLNQVKLLIIEDPFTDIDLSCLEGMSSLVGLSLWTNNVNDSSALVELDNLKSVYFNGPVTKDAYKYLFKNRPDIDIHAWTIVQ